MQKGIKEKDIKDFEKYAKKLDEVMKRILEYNPNATIYLNMDNLELHGNMPFYNFGSNCLYTDEYLVADVWIRSSSGGEK